ncbi:MAG: hypothetical protein AAGE84_17060 [Cyanobacteria bacterium P01_G01_bin.39]
MFKLSLVVSHFSDFDAQRKHRDTIGDIDRQPVNVRKVKSQVG